MTSNQKEVLRTLEVWGPMPDVALVPIAQHVMRSRQSSSGIRSRRAELARSGKITQIDEMELPSGRKAAVWAVR